MKPYIHNTAAPIGSSTDTTSLVDMITKQLYEMEKRMEGNMKKGMDEMKNEMKNEMNTMEKRIEQNMKKEMNTMEKRIEQKMKKGMDNMANRIERNVNGLRYEMKAKVVLDNHFSRGFDVSVKLESQNYRKEFDMAKAELQQRGWDARVNQLFKKKSTKINSQAKSIDIDFIKKEIGANAQSFLMEATNDLTHRLPFKLFQLERAIVYWNFCHPDFPTNICGLVARTGCDSTILGTVIKNNNAWLVNIEKIYSNNAFRLVISE